MYIRLSHERALTFGWQSEARGADSGDAARTNGSCERESPKNVFLILATSMHAI
jgi:hypothetical protein